MFVPIAINPGTGPVGNATEAHAVDNIRHFITDCDVPGIQKTRLPALDGDGRYGFLLWNGTRCHEIQMPGLPLAKVRFMEEDGQDPWEFPRLYVNGSSWLWKYALLHSDDLAEPEE